MKLLRSVGAVFAGYALIGISVELLFHLSGHDPHAPASVQFMVLTTIYGCFFAALAGFITASIAGRPALLHGAVLACLVELVAMLSLLVTLGDASIWSEVSALLFMAPAVMIGAMIRVKKGT